MGHCGTTRRKMFTEKSTPRGKTDKMIPQNNQGIIGKVKNETRYDILHTHRREKKENRNDSKEKERKKSEGVVLSISLDPLFGCSRGHPLSYVFLSLRYFPLNNGTKSNVYVWSQKSSTEFIISGG
jgi:hypothetical protein